MVLAEIIALPLGVLGATTIGPKPVLKIHPAIGVARLGNDPNDFFIGPEVPFAGPVGIDAGAGTATPPYRSIGRSGGQVKRQAARFRIFNYLVSGAVEEINLDTPEVKSIEWTVHLANRKAAFFQFDGQKGAAGPYTGAKPDPRNPMPPSVPAAVREAQLIIDPGPRTISADRGPFKVVKFDTSSGSFPKDATGFVIDFLGELQLDNKGWLLVLGGRGKSASSQALPLSPEQQGVLPGPRLPGQPAPLTHYANNDTWFDDISDGPVTAKIKLQSGKVINVDFPSWVLVGPPDFAPGIRNVISLYDTMLDVAVRKLPLPKGRSRLPVDLKALQQSFKTGKGFRANFSTDIQPIFDAGADVRFSHNSGETPDPAQTRPIDPALLGKPYHGMLDASGRGSIQDSGAGNKGFRDFIFGMLRPPAGNRTFAGPGSMPKLLGDDYFSTTGPQGVAAVTETQFHLLKLWRDGEFDVTTFGPLPLSPEGLDRAALESCVGGAFFPGIECSWLCREKDVYMEPFRVKHGAKVGALVVGPGFFSQQMAMPWQADFYDCQKGFPPGTGGPVLFGWWPAQRPDDVFTSATAAATKNPLLMVKWHRGIVAAGGAPAHLDLVNRWHQLGFVLSTTVGTDKVFFEQDRTMP